jgi:WD40 repeat protein
MNTFTRHRGPVTSTAGVPHARRVVTGAYDGAVALFDLETAEARLLGYHRHLVNRVVVDETTGARVASCSSDYTIHLWNLATGERGQILLGHSDDVEDFVFVNESLGVSASRDHRILVWNLRTGAIEHVFDEHERDVLSLAYHEGRLYSSGDDKTLRVWDVLAGRLLRTFGPFELETDTCAIDAVHGRVLLGCDDGVVRLFDVATGEPIAALPAHASGIKKVAVSRTGDFLSAAYDQKIIVWNGATLERKLELENVKHKWERSFSFAPDGETVLAGTFDGTVLEWDAATGRRLREASADGEGNACFNRVASAPDGTTVAVSDDGWVRAATITSDAASWGERVQPPSGRMLMNAVAIDAGRRLVATGAHDQRLHLYDLHEGRLAGHREAHLGEGPINFISVAEQPGAAGECFVACYSGAVARVSPQGEVLARLRVHDGAVKSVRLHPHKPLGLSCSADGQLHSWDFAGNVIERYLGHSAIINDLDLDPAGRRLASVSRDFTLKIYDVETGRLQRSLALGSRSLKSVCFASDELVFVGDYWGGLFRVDLTSGAVQRKQVANNGVSSLTRCGRLVVAASYDGSLYAIRPNDFEIAQHLLAMTQRLDLQA